MILSLYAYLRLKTKAAYLFAIPMVYALGFFFTYFNIQWQNIMPRERYYIYEAYMAVGFLVVAVMAIFFIKRLFAQLADENSTQEKDNFSEFEKTMLRLLMAGSVAGIAFDVLSRAIPNIISGSDRLFSGYYREAWVDLLIYLPTAVGVSILMLLIYRLCRDCFSLEKRFSILLTMMPWIAVATWIFMTSSMQWGIWGAIIMFILTILEIAFVVYIATQVFDKWHPKSKQA